MRIFLFILSLLSMYSLANAQIIQPTLMGDAHWEKSATQKNPEILKVAKTVLPITQNNSIGVEAKIFQNKIDPASILIHNGATIPVNQNIVITGKKLGKPEKIKARPLLTRDNAEFNISYTDKQHDFPGGFTNSFTEDSEHNIWIASESGLYKYDGYNYYLYNSKSQVPEMANTSLLYDYQNRLWLASDSGVYYIKHDSIFSIKSNEIEFSAIPCFRVQQDRNNAIWISSKRNGAIKLVENTTQIYDKRCGIEFDNITSALVDKTGTIFLGTTANGLYVIEANKLRLLFKVVKNIAVHSILSLYEDEDGVWAGGFLSGFFLLGKKDTLQFSVSGKFNERIFDIKKAPGGLWLASYSSALCYFDKKRMLIINEKNGLINRFPYFLFEDSFHNLWVSNPQSGFSRINENAFYLQKYTDSAVGNIIKVLPDKNGGNWLVTNGNSLLYQKNNTTTSFIYKYKDKVEPFRYGLDGILNDDGSLWLGSYGWGMVLAREKYFTFHTYSAYPDHNIISSIKKDGQNRVWFCPVNFGLIVKDNNVFNRYTKQSGLSANNVEKLFVDNRKNIYWTFLRGFQRMNEFRSIETFFIGKESFNDRINEMIDVDGKTTLLATKENGLLLLNKNKVFKFSTAEGISSNTIKSLVIDVYNTFWITTNNSIESFKLDELVLKDHHIYNQTNWPFIVDIECAFIDSNGLPSWSLKDKKIIINPVFLNSKAPSPVFKFTDLIIDNKPVANTTSLSIWPKNNLEIDYSVIYWGRENNLSTKILLISDSQDTSFYTASELGKFIISEILPGNYKVVLSAKDNNSFYYSDPIFITVRNYWYNTWLFRIIAMSILIGLIILYFYRKSKKQASLNRLLAEKVKEKTKELLEEKEDLLKSQEVIRHQVIEKEALIQEINHRVKNNLQFILSMIDMQLRPDFGKETTEALLSTSRRINAMSLVHEMLYDFQGKTGLAMKTYIIELIDHLKEITIDVDHPIEFKIKVETIILDSKTAVSIGMIVSELVSNSLKHAFKNIATPLIAVELFRDPQTNRIQLNVSDNGIGIKVGLSKNGFGMKMVDIFSRQLDGEYTIESLVHFNYRLVFKESQT